MKRLHLAALVGAFLPATAFAADLPVHAAPYDPPPAFTWTGFYFGANAGYAFDAGSQSRITGNNALRQTSIANGIRPNGGHILRSGFEGGGQIGYNLQLGGAGGAFVAGVEGDIAYTDIHGTATYTSDRVSTFAMRTDFIGTARARLGVTFANVLIYGTGGFAFGGVNDRASFLNPFGVQTYNGRLNTIRTGYAYGGGAEVALPTTILGSGAPAVTLKGEFLRYELGPNNLLIANNGGFDPGYTQRLRVHGNLARAGLNFKFGSNTPVVARY